MEYFGVILVALVAITAVGQAVAWATRWHREIDRLQEQARLRAVAAHQQQVAEYRRALRRYDIKALDYPCNR